MPILPVSQIVQWGTTASATRNDCGVACTAMLLSYYGKLNGLTVDALARETTLPAADVGLQPAQLATLASKHGLTLRVNHHTRLDQIRYEIDAGRPVIALIAYRFLLGRMDQADNVPGYDGHYVVVVGYDDSHFVINDPDYAPVYAERGHDALIPVTELDKALAGNGYGSQCLFVEALLIADQIIALAKQIEALAAQINQPDPTPAPAPTPIERVVNGAVNVRETPTTSAAKIGNGLAAGQLVTVIENVAVANGNTWAKITAVGAGVNPAFVDHFVAQGYLSPKA